MSHVEDFVAAAWHFIKDKETTCHVVYDGDETYVKTKYGLVARLYDNTDAEIPLYSENLINKKLKASGLKLRKGECFTYNARQEFDNLVPGPGVTLGNYLRDEWTAIEVIDQLINMDDIVALVWTNGRERWWIGRYRDGYAMVEPEPLTAWDKLLKWWDSK